MHTLSFSTIVPCLCSFLPNFLKKKFEWQDIFVGRGTILESLPLLSLKTLSIIKHQREFNHSGNTQDERDAEELTSELTPLASFTPAPFSSLPSHQSSSEDRSRWNFRARKIILRRDRPSNYSPASFPRDHHESQKAEIVNDGRYSSHMTLWDQLQWGNVAQQAFYQSPFFG
jgi:hypothetical protein